MKTIIKTWLATYLAVVGVSLACFTGFASKAFGVSPPPDGGYPNKNTAEGQDALFGLTNGNANTANGFAALKANTNGDRNTANGGEALGSNTMGDNNTADGFQALANNTTGSSNIGLGKDAGSGVTTADDVICIGAVGADISHSCYIGNIFNQSSLSGLPVFVNSDGKLGTIISSRRFKEDIKPMDKASEAILALQPVTFRYKKDFDPTGTAQFGLVAEDVAKVNPDLVVRDKEGKPYSVRYDQVNAMLLNEFLKERKKLEDQQETIAQLKSDATKQEAARIELKSTVAQQQKAMEILTAQLKEQATQIQRVCAQVEMSRTATQVAVSEP